MKFLIVEILACLIAASVLGLIVGWGMKSMFAGRTQSKLKSEWEKEKKKIIDSKKTEFDTLNNKNDSLLSEMTSLRNKIDSLTASIEMGDEAVLKAKAETKTLKATIESHEQALQQAQQYSEQLAFQQAEMQKELDTIVATKELEIQTLRQQVSAAATSDENAAISRTLSKLTGTAGMFTDSADLDGQISALHRERERLTRERADLVAQEELFSSQLTYGDDTQAYFDETIKLDALHRFTQTADSATKNDGDTAVATPERKKTVVPATAPRSSTPDTNTKLSATVKTTKHSRDKSLWDKVKSGVAKTVEKTRI